MRSREISAFIAVTVLLSAVVVTAAPPSAPGPAEQANQAIECPSPDSMGHRPPMPPPHMGLPGREQLQNAGASDVHIKSILEFQYDAEIKLIDLQAATDKAQLSLERLLDASTLDEKAILKAADALSQARGELFKQHLLLRLKVRQVMGDEIMAKLRRQGPPERSYWLGPGARDEGRKQHQQAEGPKHHDGQRPTPAER
jgi:hypothetical protein